MKNIPRSTSTAAGKARNVLCVLVGTAALVLKKHYAGPGERLIHNYGGNIAASFAVYFVLLQLPIPTVLKKPVSAGLALALVELFEAFDGFGVMTNTYDPFDFVANALGVGLALVVDTTLRFRARAPWARDGVVGSNPIRALQAIQQLREMSEHPHLLHTSLSEMTFSGLTFTILSVPSTLSLIRRLQIRTMTAGICCTLQPTMNERFLE